MDQNNNTDVTKLQAPGKKTKLTEMINSKTDMVELPLSKEETDEDGNEIVGKRVVFTENGNYELQSMDQTGFVKIRQKRGKLPEELSGTYTTPFNAQRAIEAYLNQKK